MKRAPTRSLGDVVVLRVAERLDILRAGLDGGFLDIDRPGVMRLGQAHVIEEKLVAPGDAELPFFEEHAHFRRGAVHVVGQRFHDDRHLVRRVALEDHVVHDQLFAADARAFFDRALDDVAGDALLARLFQAAKSRALPAGIGAAELGGDGDFLHQFAGGGGLTFGVDFAFREEPLATHRASKYNQACGEASGRFK